MQWISTKSRRSGWLEKHVRRKQDSSKKRRQNRKSKKIPRMMRRRIHQVLSGRDRPGAVEPVEVEVAARSGQKHRRQLNNRRRMTITRMQTGTGFQRQWNKIQPLQEREKHHRSFNWLV